MDADPALLDDLVAANHILAQQGVLDAFGHVSVRHPRDGERFLLARNLAPAQVARDDILQFNLDGEPLDARGRRVYLERFLHAAIYRARPDVNAVVHSHSASLLPWSLVPERPLRAVFHMAGFIGAQGAPVFEIRDVRGDGSDLLVRDAQLGAALARCLGERDIVLMRGHGHTVAAPSLPLSVYRAVYAEVNARCLSSAHALGATVATLSAAEAAACVHSHEAQAERAWSLWKATAAQSRARLS
jgi:ribulose-5-phosphate 4-epimerase/fuculose-1-phosphate aldolase